MRRAGDPLAALGGLLVAAAPLVAERGSALAGSRVPAGYLRHTSLVALRQVGSAWTRDQSRGPWLGRWILNRWTAREASIVGC